MIKNSEDLWLFMSLSRWAWSSVQLRENNYTVSIGLYSYCLVWGCGLVSAD